VFGRWPQAFPVLGWDSSLRVVWFLQLWFLQLSQAQAGAAPRAICTAWKAFLAAGLKKPKVPHPHQAFWGGSVAKIS
jgi:hypothetical protein